MKNIAKILVSIALILAFAVSVISCGGKKSDKNNGDSLTDVTVNIATLNGTTGFGMAKLMSDSKNGDTALKYNFEVQSDASVITGALANGDIDIAALPTNAAANLYAKTKGQIKILAVNTLGVLYVVTNKENSDIDSLEDLNGKTVYCPAQNPTFIFKGLCQKAGVNVTVDNTYVQPADLRTAVVAGKVDIAVLPEPMVTIAKSKNSDLSVAIDLTSEWDKHFEDGSLMQGCIVARTEFINENPKVVAKFLEEYKSSVNYVNESTESAAALIAEMGIFENANVAKAAIPKCNIKYIDGKAMADALSVFFGALHSINPAAVGGAVPDSGIYYNGNS